MKDYKELSKLGKHAKFLIILSLLLGLTLGVCLGIGFMDIKTMSEMKTENVNNGTYHKSPRKNFVIILQKSQQEELFNQFQKFADNNGFAMRIAPNTPGGEDFSIELWREDIMVFGANPFDPGEFRIGFYNTDGANPYPMPEWALDALVSDFKGFISEITNVTITEEE